MGSMTLMFSKSDPRAPMLLAVHEGSVVLETVNGFNEWTSDGITVDSISLDRLLSDGHIAPTPACGPVSITGTGEALLIVIYGIKPLPVAPAAPIVPDIDVVSMAFRMTDKRASALYDVRLGFITATGASRAGKTKWSSTSYNLPTGSLAWLLANGLIEHAPVPAGGTSPATTTPLGDEVLWAVAGIPPLADMEVLNSFSAEVGRVLAAAGAGKVRNMPVIGSDTPEVYIKGYHDLCEADTLNAAGKALLEHGGFDVRVGLDGSEILLSVTANPAAAPRTGVSDTHMTDVLAASGH